MGRGEKKFMVGDGKREPEAERPASRTKNLSWEGAKQSRVSPISTILPVDGPSELLSLPKREM